jgi:hypothetical protein
MMRQSFAPLYPAQKISALDFASSSELAFCPVAERKFPFLSQMHQLASGPGLTTPDLWRKFFGG